MEIGLLKFLVYYILYRRQGSLKRELGVITPFEALEKWYEIKPIRQLTDKEKVLLLYHPCLPTGRKLKQSKLVLPNSLV